MVLVRPQQFQSHFAKHVFPSRDVSVIHVIKASSFMSANPHRVCAAMNDIESTTEEGFDQAFNLNVKGPYFLIQKAVMYIPPGGRVILVSSGVLHQSEVAPRYLLYAFSKGSIEQMTRILAKDLGPKGITVNAIAPGPTATEMLFQGKTQELIDTIAGFSPLLRLGKPEEIAALAAFLAVPTSS
ncbi:3-oxoacyl-reductase [Fusarium napiforme]|uniref:3-oxoacyl-reductase n=1 Tax=Fusarium napiforme TaxID=42672 RepID=A0A8H5N3R6_9HYPO|nr:3-oxoacyl-reductase [Fusarium napiforme]